MLGFNPEKCKAMPVEHIINTEYMIMQNVNMWKLQDTEEEKDLDVLVSKDLKSSRQCVGQQTEQRRS